MDIDDMDEPVTRAVGAYLDWAEGNGPRPTFAGLSDHDRRRTVEVVHLIKLLRAMRGVDLDRDTPAFEDLLTGTEWEDSA